MSVASFSHYQQFTPVKGISLVMILFKHITNNKVVEVWH